LGYEYNIRGFDFFVVDGQSLALVKNNLKIELFSKKDKNLPIVNINQFKKFHISSYFNIFYDFAYVYNKFGNNINSFDNKYIYSYGIGLDFITYYDKILRIEYALNSYKFSGLYINFTAPL
jgi:hypothetical protein